MIPLDIMQTISNGIFNIKDLLPVISIIGVMSLPISIGTSIAVYNTTKSIDQLNAVIDRQYKLHGEKSITEKQSRLPFIRRDIVIKHVAFDQNGNATVHFLDKMTNYNMIQAGCQSLVNKIGKTYHVDYNTKTNVYAIACNQVPQ